MSATILRGDCRDRLPDLPDRHFRSCVTSPPYLWQRKYLPLGHPDEIREIGQEPTIAAYVDGLVALFGVVRQKLTDDGTLWLNLGDTYSAGGRSGGGSFMKLRGKNGWKSHAAVKGWRSPPPGMAEKQLLGIPWRVALALQDDGWWLRSEIIWHKPNAMPSGGNVRDRPTTAHEHVFLLAKSEIYFFDQDAIREPHESRPQRCRVPHKPRVIPGQPAQTRNTTLISEERVAETADVHPIGRNTRTVWTIPTERGTTEHAAPMPRSLARRCVLAGSQIGDHVLDPFGGSGTLGLVAEEEGRHATLIDLDERACAQACKRTAQQGLYAGAAS